MSFGLDWLNDLVLWLARLVPRWDICEPTHRAVKLTGSIFASLIGRQRMKVRTIEPGLYWYWPVRSRIIKYPVVRQSVDLSSQSLTTADGKPIMVSTVLVIEISDIEKAVTQNYDVDDTIREVGAAAAVSCVAPRRWVELRKAFARKEINAELKTSASKILRKYGVRVIEARFTDCVIHTALRCEGSGAGVIPYSPAEEEDE